jgi:8-oxo-dGTP diphosphatase
VASDNPRHSVSVAAAIIDNSQRVLAVRRRDNGKWEPPGGVLEENETIHAGLVREVMEETGLKVQPTVLTGVYKNMSRAIVALVFECQILEGVPRPTSETTEVRWMSAEQLRAHMDSAYAYRLLDALGEKSEPAVRMHDGVNLIEKTAKQID